MNYAAILHRPVSEYCHGLDEKRIVYRLPLRARRLETCDALLWRYCLPCDAHHFHYT